MRFPNAFKGVKKLYTAELLGLVGIIALVIAAVFAIGLVGASEANNTAIDQTSAGIISILGIVGGVIAIVAFIIEITGLIAGGKDEPLFKTALSFAIGGVIAQALASFVKAEIVQDFADIFVPVAKVMLIYYVIMAISSLAEKLGNSDMVKQGKSVITIVYITFGVEVLAKVLSGFVVTGTIAEVVEIIGYVLAIVQFVVYLSYLSKAKSMLAQ